MFNCNDNEFESKFKCSGESDSVRHIKHPVKSTISFNQIYSQIHACHQETQRWDVNRQKFCSEFIWSLTHLLTDA